MESDVAVRPGLSLSYITIGNLSTRGAGLEPRHMTPTNTHGQDMDVVEATSAITVVWLCKYNPVVFTNRSKDQPLMADPFPIYQQVVKDHKAFFRDVHGYVPLPNTKTGLAGVRSRVYTEVWRDKVILEALRIYRAHTEGASLDTVPEVKFSQKPSGVSLIYQ